MTTISKFYRTTSEAILIRSSALKELYRNNWYQRGSRRDTTKDVSCKSRHFSGSIGEAKRYICKAFVTEMCYLLMADNHIGVNVHNVEVARYIYLLISPSSIRVYDK